MYFTRKIRKIIECLSLFLAHLLQVRRLCNDVHELGNFVVMLMTEDLQAGSVLSQP